MQPAQPQHAKRERGQWTDIERWQIEQMAYRSATLLVCSLTECVGLFLIPTLKLHHHQRRLSGILS